MENVILLWKNIAIFFGIIILIQAFIIFKLLNDNKKCQGGIRMKWKDKKEVKNIDIIIVLIASWIYGFVIAYLHWGKNIPW